MTLSDWREKVSIHLQFIEAGSEMALRHAKQLPFKPDFETNAQDGLKQARASLEAALQNVIAAQAIYENKPVERSNAA